MGCASWRSYFRLREHAGIAPIGGTIRVDTGLTRGATSVLGLNEVGVTDLVMAAIWRFGPRAAAYGVSPMAEANYLGADIAIIHPAQQRILLYQAKLAALTAESYRLKSPITRRHIKLLNRRSVILDGTRYRISGRLALYQADNTPFIHRCPCVNPYRVPRWHEWWWLGTSTAAMDGPDPEVGRRYYDDILACCGCSPSGVVATTVMPQRRSQSSVPAYSTWPWEFDTHQWLSGSSPLDGPGRADTWRRRTNFQEYAPEFDRYRPTLGEIPSVDPTEVATQLARRLRLPRSHRLYVVVLG
jgi:hypothetical protein